MSCRSVVARLRTLWRNRKFEREVNDEILAHLELAELDAIALGLTPDEARHAAHRNFGGIEQMKEDHRDHGSVQWIENLLRDFRYGVGALARDPGIRRGHHWTRDAWHRRQLRDVQHR